MSHNHHYMVYVEKPTGNEPEVIFYILECYKNAITSLDLFPYLSIMDSVYLI